MIYSNVEGIWRQTWAPSVNINGVWRDTDTPVNVNGVWREVNKLEINEEDIIGFRLIYKVNPNKLYPDLPNLKYNPKIPVRIGVSGPTPALMDMEYKGVVFEYFNYKLPGGIDNTIPNTEQEEGIVCYEGRLYALIVNDLLIDVTGTQEFFGTEERVDPEIPGITDVWMTNKIYNLDIKIEAKCKFDTHGYYCAGWNSIFSTHEVLPDNKFPENWDEDTYEFVDYPLLPIKSRLEEYTNTINIGIARDLHSHYTNMVGSYGTLSQNINWITVNGVKKPFIVEVY